MAEEEQMIVTKSGRKSVWVFAILMLGLGLVFPFFNLIRGMPNDPYLYLGFGFGVGAFSGALVALDIIKVNK